MSVKKSIYIKLTSSGNDVSNFNIVEVPSNTIISSNVPRSTLVTGATYGFSLSSTGYILESTGVCTSTLQGNFPTTTTTTTTTLPYYIWSINLINSYPPTPSFCSTGNQYTTNVYTQYSIMDIGTTIYYDSNLTSPVTNMLWMRPITLSLPGLSDTTIYKLSAGVITNTTLSIC